MRRKRKAVANFQATVAPSSETDEKMLPVCCYADVAPLPIPFAEYQLGRLRKFYAQEHPQAVLALFLKEVRAARETAFEVMDDFVRNQDAPVSPDMRLSTEWLTKNLAAYDPLKTMPSATYKNWQRRGIIRMDGHGKPRPSSAAAALLVRMIDRQKEHIFPLSLASSEPDYWCIVIESPASEPEVLPVDLVHLLPGSAVVVTEWAGASWDLPPSRWLLIGENEGNLGAIRFAGTKYVKGKLWWNIDLAELIAWDKQAVSLYVPLAGDEERQVEDLANAILHRLFAMKKPVWQNKHKKTNQHASLRATQTSLQSLFDNKDRKGRKKR
jgi:hypothetical protein